jgi:hypothetical protein
LHTLHQSRRPLSPTLNSGEVFQAYILAQQARPKAVGGGDRILDSVVDANPGDG